MSFYEAAWHLGDLLEATGPVYLRIDPEVLDFTSHGTGKIIIENARGKLELDLDQSNVASIAGLLSATVFDRELCQVLLTWNLKPLLSYFRFYLQKYVTPTNSVIDLRVIENFLGAKKKCPENFIEALNRSKVVSNYKSWKPIYKSIHLPLMLRVLPSIESTPLLDESTRGPVYPYYEIEGQVNGRLNCLKKFDRSYLAHTLGDEQKRSLKPRGYGWIFATSDFRHCEVTVLQWLTKDETLKQMLDSGLDLHSEIYRVVCNDACDTPNKRRLSQGMFLPVIYGCGAKGLASNLGLGDRLEVAEELLGRIKNKFTTAMGWAAQQQKTANEEGLLEDHFGRIRRFEDGEGYRARNFAVQGVAAIACQERLIELHKVFETREDIRLVYSVHDGFVMICQPQIVKEVYKTLKEVLEADSVLCPGLRMKVGIKFGKRLDDMKAVPPSFDK